MGRAGPVPNGRAPSSPPPAPSYLIHLLVYNQVLCCRSHGGMLPRCTRHIPLPRNSSVRRPYSTFRGSSMSPYWTELQWRSTQELAKKFAFAPDNDTSIVALIYHLSVFSNIWPSKCSHNSKSIPTHGQESQTSWRDLRLPSQR